MRTENIRYGVTRSRYGRTLRKERRARGASARKLAAALGVDHTYISQLELLKVGPPTAEMAKKIADVLSSDELLVLAESLLPCSHLIEISKAAYEEIKHEIVARHPQFLYSPNSLRKVEAIRFGNIELQEKREKC